MIRTGEAAAWVAAVGAPDAMRAGRASVGPNDGGDV